MSDLSEEQIGQIKSWVSEGAQMADVQKRLKDDFDLNTTYMDTRFLALDLELEFIKEEVPEVPEEAAEVPAEEVASIPEAAAPAPEAAAPVASPEVEVMPTPEGGPSVSVGVDQIAIPGSMVSGTMTFTDGEKGRWMIDEMGRPSIDPETPAYQPTQADLEDF